MKKVAVIGIDGLGWPVLNKVLERNGMPTLNDLLSKSIRGILKSTVPPVTPPAWTSIASGVNPGKHGIFDFVIYTDNETRIVNAMDIQYPRVHEMVAIRSLRSICINLPLTFPIIRIKNCIVISDWLAPKVSYYPKFLREYISDYPIHVPISHYERKKDFLDGVYTEASARARVIRTLMEDLDWDLFWTVFSESDHLLHKCYEEVWNGDKKALKVFQVIDETVRKASELADLIIVVSDHGFSRFRYFINVNSFLNSLGLVTQTWKKTLKEFTDFEIDATTKRIKMPQKIYRIASIKPIKLAIKKIFKALSGKDVKAELPYVDPANSKAFMSSSMSLGIHAKDEFTTELIIKKLKKLKGISNAWRREDIYRGPFLKKAPEVLLLPDFDNGCSIGTIMLHPRTVVEKIDFWHHPDGVIAMSGRDVTPAKIGVVKAFDLSPTILRYLGLPIPIDTDGNPLPNLKYPQRQTKHYDYLKHWQLIKQIQLKKSKLAC